VTNVAVETLRHDPEVALLLSLAIGYAAGGLSFLGIALGTTVSMLLAAVAIGQAGITIDPLVKSLLFALFIFTVGYRGGPQLVATLFGQLVLRMKPVIPCGALAGAQTNAAVPNSVNDVSGSTLAVLGFTLPFAVNNMILTVAAPIVVSLL
jgi:uncharacterized transporter YbjL